MLAENDRSPGYPDSCPAVAARPRLSWFWPIGCILAVLYLSLLPFDFSFLAFSNAFSSGLAGLRFRSTTPDDAITNLLAYLPVGMLLGLYATRGRWRWWAGVLAAIFVGTTLSILIEVLQTGLASRVPSWTDVLLNAIGCASGACLGIGLFPSVKAAWAQLCAESLAHPFTTAASMLTLGLFLYELAPFDFVKSTNDLHASFARSHWSFMNARVTNRETLPFAAMAHQLSGAGWFAALGFLAALGGRERGRLPRVSLGSALKDGLILATLVEFMQLLTRSHTFDTATVVMRSIGVILGAWCALFVVDFHTGSQWRRKPSVAFPTGVVAMLFVLQIALLVAPYMSSTWPSLARGSSAAVDWLPFESLWRLPCHTAIAEMLSTLAIYGALSLTLGVLLRRLQIVHATGLVFAALTLLVTASEGLRLITLDKPMRITSLILAMFAAYLAPTLWRNLQPAKAHENALA